MRSAVRTGPMVAVVAALALMPASELAAGILISNGGAAQRITEHADGAQGNAPPLRAIQGDLTRLHVPAQLFADALHNELFVGQSLGNHIAVFPLDASGNASPIRVLEGPATLLSRAGGVVVDLVHDELIVSNFNNGVNGYLTVYPRTAAGNVAPLRRIQGPATGLQWAANVAVDPVANEIYVASQVPQGSVRVFSRTANGNVAPVRVLTGPATKLRTVYGVYVDRARDQLIVTEREGAISIFRRTANGNRAPLARIEGNKTGLLETLGVAPLGNSELVVANGGAGGHDYSDDAVLVFPRFPLQGNLAPTRRINGPATQLSGPIGVATPHPLLQLNNQRFAVEVVWRTPQGQIGGGQPVLLTPDTGYVSFLNPANVEVFAKIVDGCGTPNGRFWFFAAGLTNVNVDLRVTDTWTGRVKAYSNPQGHPFLPIQDTNAFATCGAAPPATAGSHAGAWPPAAPLELAAPKPDGLASITSPACGGLCLEQGRFEVSATWRTEDAQGVATALPISGNTGYLWFFKAANVEVVLKVLNGCDNNGHFWFFAGGLTNVEVEIKVTDTLSGEVQTYTNPLGRPFQPIQDTSAFATCP